MKAAPKNIEYKGTVARVKPGRKVDPDSAKRRVVPKLSRHEESLLTGISTSGSFTLEKVLKRHS